MAVPVLFERCGSSARAGALLFICILGLSPFSCRHRDADHNAAYARIAAIRRSEPQKAVLEARQAYEELKTEGSETAWRFRLIYADLLLDTDKPRAAANLLKGDLAAPHSSDLQARLAVVRMRLASASADAALIKQRQAELSLLPASSDPCIPSELLSIKIQSLINSGDFDDSAKRLIEMEQAAKSCPDPYWLAMQHYLSGLKSYNEFRYEDAMASYLETLALARQHRLKTLTPLLVGSIASCQLNLGDTDAALNKMDEAEEGYRETGQEFQRSIDRGERGIIDASLKRFDKADIEFREALRGATEYEYRPYVAIWLNELTSLSCDTGDLKSARDFSRQALKTADPEKDKDEYASAQLNAARIARLENAFAEARRRLAPLRSNGGSNSFRWQVQAETAQLLVALNHPTEAGREFRGAIDTAESARAEINDEWSRITFSSQALALYQSYVDFLIDRKEYDLALRVAESSHARQLSEKLQSGVSGNFAKVAHGQQAVILSYWLAGARSYMWATTAQGSRMFPLGDTSRLGAQIENYRREIDRRTNFLLRPESSQKLYGQLIAPAAALIPEAANVIVIPDGPLANLNFETLIAPGKAPRYWLESVSVRVAPSLTLLHEREHVKDPIDSLYLVGGTKPPPPFAELPGSQDEIDSIGHLFRSAKPLVSAGDEATPSRFLQSDPGRFSLIHLSAHAVAVKENPLDSSIILTPDKPRGNFRLYARDLAALKLHAGLVTLSACQGAGAKAVPGEGLVGLTWAFLSAGAHNVVAGLWNVPDKGSAALMKRFYSGLKMGETPGEALRGAKLAMLHEQAAPYYWAAFQLYSR